MYPLIQMLWEDILKHIVPDIIDMAQYKQHKLMENHSSHSLLDSHLSEFTDKKSKNTYMDKRWGKWLLGLKPLS